MLSQDSVARARTLLVEHSPAGRRSRVDAIIVSTHREVGNLVEASALAIGTGALLVAVCSRHADASDAAGLIASSGHERWMVIDLPADWWHPLVEFSSDRVPEAVSGRAGRDLHVKLNIALLLTRLAGWSSVLLLDDDIRGLQPARVQRGAALLESHDLIGFRATDFPDNSVLRHARRLAGFDQDVFISNNALVAGQAAVARAFFPIVYNTDWLFAFPTLTHRPAATIGTVSQVPYDPFDPERAHREQFGEFIAEGLMDRLLTEGSLDAPPYMWWNHSKTTRERMQEELIARLAGDDEQTTRARVAVETARATLEAIPPEACADYVTSWHGDLATWQRRIAELPTSLSPAAAAARLRLPVLCSTELLHARVRVMS